MIRGDIVYIDLKYLTSQVVNNIDDIPINVCHTIVPVFWDTTSDPYKNDTTGIIFFSNNSITTARIYLVKGSQETLLSNSQYGTPYSFGFIDNRYSQKAVGYKLDWKKVYQMFGNGEYKIICKRTPLIGSEIIEEGLTYNLMQYTQTRADNTVRLEWYMNGITGDNQEGKWDYLGKNFYMQLRIPNSTLIEQTPNFEATYEKEFNGKSILVNKLITNKFTLNCSKLPYKLYQYIKLYAMQSDNVLIKDFNLGNFNKKTYENLIFTSVNDLNGYGYSENVTVSYELEEFVQNKRHIK